MRIWNSGPALRVYGTCSHGAAVRTVAFSPQGDKFATGTDAGVDGGEVRLWDWTTFRLLGKPLEEVDPISGLAFGRTGTNILVANRKTVTLRNAMDGQRMGLRLRHNSGRINVIAISADGRTAATGGTDGTARIWELPSGKQRCAPFQHSDAQSVSAIGFSPDGAFLATGTESGAVCRWQVDTGRPTVCPDGHRGVVRSVAFSPDGMTLMTAGEDRTVRFWNAATLAQDGKPLEHPGIVNAAAFSHDGKLILTGCDDWLARLWHTKTRTQLAQLRHRGPVLSVAFRNDDTTALTGSSDGTAILWSWPQPLPGDPARVVAFIEDLTGMEIDHNGEIHSLDSGECASAEQASDILKNRSRGALTERSGVAGGCSMYVSSVELLPQCGRQSPWGHLSHISRRRTLVRRRLCTQSAAVLLAGCFLLSSVLYGQESSTTTSLPPAGSKPAAERDGSFKSPCPPLPTPSLKTAADQAAYLADLPPLLDKGLGSRFPNLEAVRPLYEDIRARCPEDPRPDYTWGLICWRAVKYDEATQRFEAAMNHAACVYLPAYQAFVRLQLARKRYQAASDTLVRLANALQSTAATWPDELGKKRLATWMGYAMAYLDKATTTSGKFQSQ